MEARELRRAAMQTARRGREVLAELIARVDGYPDDAVASLTAALSVTVGRLFAAETRQVDGVHEALRSAMTDLSSLLARLSAVPSSPMTTTTMEGIAQALSVLHPTRAKLERALHGEGAVALPIPLSRRRERREPNRRHAPRAEIETDIGFNSATNFYTGFAGDLSDGGIFVATYDVLPVGTKLSLSFVLPGGHPITADGTVSWVSEPRAESDAQPGMGVVFRDLGADEREEIMRFIARREPLFHEH